MFACFNCCFCLVLLYRLGISFTEASVYPSHCILSSIHAYGHLFYLDIWELQALPVYPVTVSDFFNWNYFFLFLCRVSKINMPGPQNEYEKYAFFTDLLDYFFSFDSLCYKGLNVARCRTLTVAALWLFCPTCMSPHILKGLGSAPKEIVIPAVDAFRW